MTELSTDPSTGDPLAAAKVSAAGPAPVGVVGVVESSRTRLVLTVLLTSLTLLALVAIALAWRSTQRIGAIEQELVRRQQTSADQANEARQLAKDAQDGVRDASAKVALLAARVAELSVQRGQLEDLIQTMARSRDDNLLADIEGAIRVAQQQSAVTGSAEPMVAALKQTDERLGRRNEPRLDGVRRAVVRDLDRIKATSVTDVAALDIKLDEAIRMVDDLPLQASAAGHREAALASPAAATGASAAEASGFSAWTGVAGEWWTAATAKVWAEIKSLVRVTRVDHPEAMLLAPDQGLFVRENLKLRLLNARLALLSRQFGPAQSDLTVARDALERYFDRGSRRTALALDLVRQVASQAHPSDLPRPDDTLTALAAAGVTR